MSTRHERVELPGGGFDMLTYVDGKLTRAIRHLPTILDGQTMYLQNDVLDAYVIRSRAAAPPAPRPPLSAMWTIVTLDANGEPQSRIPVAWVPHLTWTEELQPGVTRVFVLVDVEIEQRVAYYAAIDSALR